VDGINVQHSENLSEEGEAWMKTVGAWKESTAIPAQDSEEDPLDLRGKQPVFQNMEVEWWALSLEQ
jgi:hypothetical protein